MDDSFDEDSLDIDDDDFDTIDFLDDEEDDDEIEDEPLPFSSSEDLDDSDSYQSSSSKADSSKERSAIDEALDLIAPFTQAIAQAKKDALKKKNEKKTAAHDCQYYSFRNFSQASQLGSFLAPFYEGESSLYKDSVSNNYYMILRKAEGQEDTFRRACNIAADFGVRISASYATPAYFRRYSQKMPLKCFVSWFKISSIQKIKNPILTYVSIPTMRRCITVLSLVTVSSVSIGFFYPILNCQIIDSIKFFYVIRDYNQLLRFCMCCDQHIHRTNRRSFLLQISSYFSVLFCHSSIKFSNRNR